MEARLGGLVFQNPCKKQIETHFFRNDTVRYLGSLGLVSGAILAHFGKVLDLKMVAKIAPKLIKMRTQFGVHFELCFCGKVRPQSLENQLPGR